MPFWWRRRKRFWYGRRYKRRYPQRRYKKRRRPYRRRRHRRFTRRRRRRRGKVRKKKPTLVVRQWQPDRIVHCKIKGYEALILGAEGTQYLCSTTEKYNWVKTKYPGGGVFAVQLYSLKYLYDQWKLKNNIWTKTNDYTDLCRYLKVKFVFYRHHKVDFIVIYNRQPPFQINHLTYQQYHPYLLLQMHHKRIIPSLQTNPRGKSKVKITIRPPKQMLSKWFFQKEFSEYDLLLLAGSACSLKYPRLGCCNENRIFTFYYLNPGFFSESSWGHTLDDNNYYKPYTGIPDLEFWSGRETAPTKYKPKSYIEQAPSSEGKSAKYYRSIDYTGGYFSSRVLQAWDVLNDRTKTRPLPIGVARYNPELDDGKGNEVWLTSIFGGHYDKPSLTPDAIIVGLPLWQAFWGYWSYLQQKKTKGYFSLNMFVVKSPYIYPQPTEITKNYYPFIDLDFIQGKNPFDSFLTVEDKKLWYPTCHRQIKTINAFCSSGPYVPKLSNDRESTWELPINYTFHFKWGGPQLQDQPVSNPKTKDTYPVPDTIKEAIQIHDPSKNIAATMFHQWDYRRGCITSSAIKRMSENLETDTSISSDAESTPKKKRRVQPLLHDPEKETQEITKCLLSLCEETTCQEEKTPQDLLKLINQQQQQQQQLKHNLLILIKDLKAKQRSLQLQTGILE